MAKPKQNKTSTRQEEEAHEAHETAAQHKAQQLLRRRLIGAFTLFAATFLLWGFGGALPPQPVVRAVPAEGALAQAELPPLSLPEAEPIPVAETAAAEEEKAKEEERASGILELLEDAMTKKIPLLDAKEGEDEGTAAADTAEKPADKSDAMSAALAESLAPVAAEEPTPKREFSLTLPQQAEGVSTVATEAPTAKADPPAPPAPEKPAAPAPAAQAKTAVAAPSPAPTTPAAPAKKPTPTPTTATSAYGVQVGTFSKEAHAQKTARAIKAQGFAVAVLPLQSNGKQLWRVRAVGFDTRKAAKHGQAQLNSLGYADAQVVATKDAPAAAPAKKAAAPKPPAAAYRLRVGVYRQVKYTRAAVVAIEKAGAQASTQSLQKDGVKLTRVLATGLASKAAAEQLQKTLAAVGYTGTVVEKVK